MSEETATDHRFLGPGIAVSLVSFSGNARRDLFAERKAARPPMRLLPLALRDGDAIANDDKLCAEYLIYVPYVGE